MGITFGHTLHKENMSGQEKDEKVLNIINKQ